MTKFALDRASVASAGKKLVKWGGLPALLYLIGLTYFAWPWVSHFTSALVGNAGDPLQNLWNMWWFQHALDNHQSLYYTNFLHWPEGSTLLGQTLSPWNDLIALPLTGVFGRIVAYNILILGSFFLTGLATFWLAYQVSKEYWGSVLAGAVATFSTYHFVHADSHYTLAAMQTLPLALLAWLLFLRRPRIWLGIATGLLVTITGYTDLYYGLYMVLGLGVLTLLLWLIERPTWAGRESQLIVGTVAVLIGIGLTYPLVHALTAYQSHDPFVEVRDPSRYSLDAVSWIIPSFNSDFAETTKGLWSKFGGAAREVDVHLGVSLTLLFIVSLVAGLRNQLTRRPVLTWLAFSLVFFSLALGPVLHVASKVVKIWHYHGHEVFLPYNYLAKILPSLSVSGVAVRFFVPCLIGIAVVLAIGVPRIWRKALWSRAVVVLALAVAIIELHPVTTAVAPLPNPGWVAALQRQPDPDTTGVIDLDDDQFFRLYYQTLYERPQAFGYLSRTPQSVANRETELRAAISRGDWQWLCRTKHFRYVTYPNPGNKRHTVYPRPAGREIYSDTYTSLYDLAPRYGPDCRYAVAAASEK